MQLVAMGAQDVYLTGNPQITFFKVVYRRHTNFSKECIAQTFSGSVPTTDEGSVTCTLARNGDLVQEIYLKTNYTLVGGGGGGGDSQTTSWPQESSINTAQEFARLKRLYNNDVEDLISPFGGSPVKSTFFENPERNAYRKIGISGDTVTYTPQVPTEASEDFKSLIKLDINNDGFLKNALINTDEVDLKDLIKNPIYVRISNTYENTDHTSTVQNRWGVNLNGSTETSFVTPYEIFKIVPFMYKYDNNDNYGNEDPTSNIVKYNFIYWILEKESGGRYIYENLTTLTNNPGDDNFLPNLPLFVVGGTGSSSGSSTSALSGVDATTLIKTVEVEIGGQKIDKHYCQWLDIYNELFETSHDYRESLCNANNSSTADGATNYIPLRFWFNRNPGLALPLIALQYHEVKINMTLNPKLIDGTNSVSITDAKLLVNYIYLDTDERRRFAQVSHEYLIEQVQHTGVESESPITMNFNHPVKSLFWTAPGATLGAAKIQLNGHDRAASQPHDYYHLVQPYENGLGHSGKSLNTTTRTWDYVVNTTTTNNVGMYSFCLKPAEHQPSGTCNFSRIDNARLNLAGVSNSYGVYLFAMNYNVLRIMSGMGGLAYSN